MSISLNEIELIAQLQAELDAAQHKIEHLEKSVRDLRDVRLWNAERAREKAESDLNTAIKNNAMSVYWKERAERAEAERDAACHALVVANSDIDFKKECLHEACAQRDVAQAFPKQITDEMEDETGGMPVDRNATVEEIIAQVRLLKNQLDSATEFYAVAQADARALAIWAMTFGNSSVPLDVVEQATKYLEPTP